MTGHALGIDIGGTKTSAAVAAADGTLGPVRTEPTPRGPQAVLDLVVDLIRDRTALAAGAEITCLGVGTAGVVDEHGTITSATSTLPGWAGTEVGVVLARRTGLPTTVLNDVHAFATAEARIGAGRGLPSLLAVMVGTGIGGAFVGPTGLWRGATGTAGSVGHVSTPLATGLPCSCGGSGHVESIASGPGIVELYRARHGTTLTTRAIAELARTGDRQAVEVLTHAGAALGEALAGIVDVLDPQVVVLAGGALQIGPGLLGAAVAALRSTALPGPARVPVRTSELGAAAVLIGAGFAARSGG